MHRRGRDVAVDWHAGPHSVSEAIARRATALLVAVHDGDPHAVGLYDDLLFEMLGETALRRGLFLAADAAARFGSSMPSGDPSGVDWEAVAAGAACTALKRASPRSGSTRRGAMG